MFVRWDMYPIVTVFGRRIGLYIILAAVGTVAATFVYSLLYFKRGNTKVGNIVIYVLLMVASLFLGGRLLFAFTKYDELFAVFADLFKAPFGQTLSGLGKVFGGGVFYGGLAGCIAVTAVLKKRSLFVDPDNAFDILAVVIPLFHGFGRIGCFLAGCCYGVECEFGFASSANELVPAVVGVRRFPVQLAEALFNFILFAVLLCLFNKRCAERRLIFIYLYSYSTARFILEFFRGDANRGIFFGLSTSQWISILIVIICTIILTARKLYKGKRAEAIN